MHASAVLGRRFRMDSVDAGGHDLAYARFLGGLSKENDFAGVIAFRYDAEDIILVLDDERSHVLLGHQPEGIEYGGVGADGPDVTALLVQYLFYRHHVRLLLPENYGLHVPPSDPLEPIDPNRIYRPRKEACQTVPPGFARARASRHKVPASGARRPPRHARRPWDFEARRAGWNRESSRRPCSAFPPVDSREVFLLNSRRRRGGYP